MSWCSTTSSPKLGPDSRVVRLFDPAAMPTPGAAAMPGSIGISRGVDPGNRVPPMRRKRCTRRWPSCAVRFARSFADRQRLDRRCWSSRRAARSAVRRPRCRRRSGPGSLNSASSSPSHIRSTICARSPGPECASAIWWRSPMKVSDCQSIERTSVSKILSRGTPARAIRRAQQPDAAGDMAIRFIARRLQIGADPLDGRRPRIAPVAQIEDKARIANGFSSETGRSRCHFGAEIFYFSEANAPVISL